MNAEIRRAAQRVKAAHATYKAAEKLLVESKASDFVTLEAMVKAVELAGAEKQRQESYLAFLILDMLESEGEGDE